MLQSSDRCVVSLLQSNTDPYTESFFLLSLQSGRYFRSEFMMEELSYVPRINQLDAETLDDEFLSDFNEQISNAFRLFLRYSTTWPGSFPQ